MKYFTYCCVELKKMIPEFTLNPQILFKIASTIKDFQRKITC